MAVIPGGSHPVPDGAKQSGADLALIQNLTEADVRNQIKGQALLPWQSAHGSFFTNIIGGIGQALQQGLAGLANSVGSWAASFFSAGEQVRDGQEDLNDRTDLLLPFTDRGSCYMDSVEGWYNGGIMPFNKQVGPLRNIRFENNGMTLLDKGQWEIEAVLTASWVRLVTAEVSWRIAVYKPDGSLCSQQRYTMTNANNMTMTLVTDVVVKDTGYTVKVEVLTIGNGRGIIGGAPWNRLTVRHLNRNTTTGEDGSGTATGNPTNPDGNIVGSE